MRRGFPDAFLSITGVLYLGLMTGVLISAACWPVPALLLAGDPGRTWPLVALLAPLVAPALSAAFATFSSYSDDGSVSVIRTFVSAWRRTFRRAIVLGAPSTATLTVLILDVTYLWGRRLGALAIPPLVMASVLIVPATLTALVIAQDRPRARLRQVIAVAAFVTIRRWYLSAVSIVVLLILGAAVVKAPAIGLGVALGPVAYLLWANARHSFSTVVAPGSVSAQKGAQAS